MLDIKYITENKDLFKDAAQKKKLDPSVVDKLIEVDKERRALIKKSDDLRSEQKKEADRGKATNLKAEFKQASAELELIEKEFESLIIQVPTIPSDDTPIGQSEADNVEVYRSGKIPEFDFKPKDHMELAKHLDLIDFERGVKVSGFRGYYLKNQASMLALALMMYALKKMVSKGYTPMIPPTLVKEFALFGSGYFKSGEYDPSVDEIYQVATQDKEESGVLSKDKKFLIGTAEPSLLAYYSDEVLEEKNLPLKLCGFSQCYRSEIGSYGKDTKGLYRVHEFMKVEQVVLSKADIEESDKIQQEMVGITKEIHEDLGLPFRMIQICTGDLTIGKRKQFDFEVWLPGMNRWAETGSASNFLDWQSRRLNVKYKAEDGGRKHVYMLNNTALPTPRPIIAIIENYQTKEGNVVVPEVLREYLGVDIIKPRD